MNRIAITIKEARQKAKMSEKDLAKKCGLTANYIIQIESGKKVINEKAAEKILKALGQKPEIVNQMDAVVEEKPQRVKEDRPEVKKKEVFQPVEPTEQWSDALSNIIKKFPVQEINSNKVVAHKELPVLSKKIDGYHWEKLMFFQVNDDELEALRIKKNDVVMICMTNEIHNNSVYLFEMNQKRMLRQLRKEAHNKVTIWNGKKGAEPISTELNKIKLIGKCVKVEFEL